MCFGETRISRSHQWNWDGDRIIHDSIVPSSRPPVGRQRGTYPIDVREFLITERNAVVRRTLEVDITEFIAQLEGASLELFRSRQAGAFDHRAYVITEFVSQHIKYRRTAGLDPWQFPDETLSLKSGDCEDRALLIASLLLASGISSFNVRVALGKFRAWFGRKHQDFDHVWVMYKNEMGKWQIIEPAHVKRVEGKVIGKQLPTDAEYIPQFLFNDVHLWHVPRADDELGLTAVKLKRDWSSLHPEFAGWVHRSILNEALTPDVCPPWVLSALNRHFSVILGRRAWTVDDVDLPTSYDPRDHFDNGYILDGWQQVNNRLAQFKGASVTSLDAFAKAAHGIADFYAHTSYAHFAKVQGGMLTLCTPDTPTSGLAQSPNYGAGSSFDLVSDEFSINAHLWTGTTVERASMWNNKLISGRYAQKGDSHSPYELITFIPSSLQKAPNFPVRGSLPHHNEIAVDEPLSDDQPPSGHVLYDAQNYATQYQLRYTAAVRHIHQAFQQNWRPS